MTKTIAEILGEERPLPQQMDIPGVPYYIKLDGTVWHRHKRVPDTQLKVFAKHQKGVTRQQCLVKLPIDGRPRAVSISWIMKRTYFRDIPEGWVLVHKNGSDVDHSVWNLQPMSRSEMGKLRNRPHDAKCVQKVDPATGEVIAVYKSAREAGRQNYMTGEAVCNACNRKNKKKPGIGPDGYRYEWED